MMIGERTVKRQSSVSVARKRLADVTNSPAHAAFPRDDYVNRLVQENLALARALEDKTKAIELNTAELNKLRAMNQKMQMQNWGLAQSNSQMLAELKLGREKMKTLQHQLVCKIVLLKVKDSELQEVAADPLDKPEDVARTSNHTAFVPINSTDQCEEKEMAKPKRHCMRRHSAQFGFQDQEATVCSTPQGSGRPSIGRPSRRAAEKVRSYKEPPLNTKIRRSTLT
ncbi:hypothetical protein MLD38_011671 [Melastoma candidum]|uniref:Uncharacterized protein n=1 Tax=Melastoma candidum TaxID=119954 RepID=A0ACB9R3U0_9MYRT|nr:hypothetical protein MLD38_011671 [Melastoma candidum]